MNKACQPSPPMRKRRTMRKSPEKETSKLEQKLDGLVTLLTSATQSVPAIINPTATSILLEPSGPPNYEINYGSTPVSSASLQHQVQDGQLLNSERLPETRFTSGTSSSSESTLGNVQHPAITPAIQPSPEEAESYLNKFRTHHSKHLPFIVLAPSVTSHRLRQYRPILWACIMYVLGENPFPILTYHIISSYDISFPETTPFES